VAALQVSDDAKPKLATVDMIPGRRWNAHAALGEAMQRASMDAPMVVMWLDGSSQEFKFAIANATNMQCLWMAEALKVTSLKPEK
jgi:hypothetical protein